MSYVVRLSALVDVSSRREIRRELLKMAGEVLDKTEKEATILRGLELAARLTGACDMTAQIEAPGAVDLSRFERDRRAGGSLSSPLMQVGATIVLPAAPQTEH